MIKSIKYALLTRKAWFFVAAARNKSRFSRTILGGYWFGVSNLLSIGLISIFYTKVLNIPNPRDYVVYLGLGMVSWQCFSHSIVSSGSLFQRNQGNIKSSNINPIFYGCENWAYEMYNFIQSFSIVIFCLSFIKPILIFNFFIYSLPSLINFIFAILWFPLLLSIAVVRYKDIAQIIPVVLQFLFLTSPILYKSDRLGKLKIITDFNPMYKLVSNLRDSIINADLFLISNLKLLIFNFFGILLTIFLLNFIRRKLPFYV